MKLTVQIVGPWKCFSNRSSRVIFRVIWIGADADDDANVTVDAVIDADIVVVVGGDVIFNGVEISFNFDKGIGDIEWELVVDNNGSLSAIVVNKGPHSGLKNHDAIDAHWKYIIFLNINFVFWIIKQ